MMGVFVLKLTTWQRYSFFTGGVIFTALGISLITKAGLGTSAISSPAYVLSLLLPYSFGAFTVVCNSIMILSQILLLRREFPPIHLLQFPAALLLGVLIDFYLFFMSGWVVVTYPVRLAVLLCGCAVLGLGIGLQVIGDVLMLPSEGLVRVLSYKLHREFEQVKTMLDICLVIFSAILCLLFTHSIAGVREGTLIAALTTGSFSRFFHRQIAALWMQSTAR